MPDAHPLRIVAGCFLEARDVTWRLDAIDGKRWTVRCVDRYMLREPESIVPFVRCRLLRTHDVYDDALKQFFKESYVRQRGSKEGDIHGDDYSGASWTTPTIVVRKKKFTKRFRGNRDTITALLNMWGPPFVCELFVRLKTLSGYFDAKEKLLLRYEESYSPALAVRGNWHDDDDGDVVTPEGSRERDFWVKGNVPDFASYHDTTTLAAALQLLYPLARDTPSLKTIAAQARNNTVRDAAKLLIEKQLVKNNRAA